MKGGKISKRTWWIIGIVIVLIILAVLIFKPGILLSPAGPDCRADFNGDGAIDIIDLGLLGGQWGTDGTGNPEGFSADGIEDGIVNLQDLALLGANWGADCSVVVRPTRNFL